MGFLQKRSSERWPFKPRIFDTINKVLLVGLLLCATMSQGKCPKPVLTPLLLSVSGAISHVYSRVTGLTDLREYVPTTVVLTAYDTNNNRIWSGGETVNLRVE